VGGDVKALEEASRANDLKRWVTTAHRLYGASANVGASGLSALCNEAQHLGKIDARLTAHICKSYHDTAAQLSARGARDERVSHG